MPSGTGGHAHGDRVLGLLEPCGRGGGTRRGVSPPPSVEPTLALITETSTEVPRAPPICGEHAGDARGRPRWCGQYAAARRWRVSDVSAPSAEPRASISPSVRESRASVR
ncbi:hypothetical protein GCM10010251_89150 [Streptomyces aurantiogriseus]|uniref:Uncharacterized protein n=1 Tax=Streptomyces aurantiogriseus TaxID=66870 RepID=A0A918FNA1_9ACTN|nr:hypothetical protein GCM10010251_89150 [Streptomyces aurantiogriseus]